MGPEGLCDPDSTTYTGALETAEKFGQRLFLEAWKRGGSRASIQMGDGAEGIRKVAALHFPGAIGMVDLPIYWIRSDFLPMIITAALTLTCGSVADLWLRMDND